MANNELQIRQWFSMLLNIDPKSENLPVNQRRKKFERKLPGILASISHGGEWKIFITNWQSPRPGKKKHRLTVILKEKANHPPTEPTVPKKPTPPPAM